MKKESRKLNLNRETITLLQDQDLRRINGGGDTVDLATSSAACIAAGSYVVTKTIDASLKIWEVTRQSKPSKVDPPRNPMG